MHRSAKFLLVTVWLALTTACQEAGSAPSSSPHPPATATAAPTSLAACPSDTAPTGPQLVKTGLSAPDDLAFDSRGRLLYSDINTGAVSAINADGSVERLAAGLSEPEGMLVLPDGRILVAEQGRNRVMAIDPQTHRLTLWRAFGNHTSNAGIDGIGPIIPAALNGTPLATAGDVIVPDSPNGLVWAVTPDGRGAVEIARGMTRPVGAAVDQSGRIFVADEGGALWVLDPRMHRVAVLATPDDVAVTHSGAQFVNTLGDNAIHELDAQGRRLGILSGISQPQGIALDGADNLYYTEFTTGRIERRVRTFLLQPARVTQEGGQRFIVCPMIGRASGFTDSLALNVTAGNGLSVLQTVQPGADSSGAVEVRTGNPTLQITVSDPSAGLGLSQSISLPQ